MAQSKKLAAEIDRTCKKINEGIELFDGIWDKLHGSTNVSHKERFQGELKTEIKKLQRMRDQIKTWQGMSDVRDKRQIDEARKRIEEKMEQFKACEREAKIKTFSKIGLAQASKEDPEEAARDQTRQWLNRSIESLAESIEAIEADIEVNHLAGKKEKKKRSTTNKQELEAQRERIADHRGHIEKLEEVLKGLEHEKLTPDDIEPIQEIVNNYIEHHQDHSYDPAEMEGVYDGLLFEDGATFPDAPPEKARRDSEQDDGQAKKDVRKDERKKKKDKGDAASSQADNDSKASTPATPSMPTPPSHSLVAQAIASKAAAQAAAAGASTSASTVMPSATAAQPQPKQPTAAAAAPAPAPAAKTPAVPTATAANYAQAAKKAQQPAAKKSAPSTPTATPPTPTLERQASQPGGPSTAASAAATLRSGKGRDGAAPPAAATAAAAAAAPSPTTAGKGRAAQQQQPQQQQPQTQPQPQQAQAQQQQQQQQPQQPEPLPPRSPCKRYKNPDRENVERMLQQSYDNLPTPQDTRRRQAYTPANPRKTPSYYPQQPHPIFEQPETFANLDCDTLFFIFYYNQGTYQQYLAAKQLKKKSWRFHKDHHTWFQRADPPTVVNEDFEQGNYIFFDYDGDWARRVKQDFTFKYQYLEDELVSEQC